MTEASLDLQALAHRLEKLENQKSRRNVLLVLPLLIFFMGGVSRNNSFTSKNIDGRKNYVS